MRPSVVPRWTISVLTIPEREGFLTQLLSSIARLPQSPTLVVDVVYNRDIREDTNEVERRLARLQPQLNVRVHFNHMNPTIGGGRALQLNQCRTPLVAFVDDDLTLHGDVLGTVETLMRRLPLAAIGIPSLVEDSGRRFKPRDSTPSIELHGVRYMPVQGMLVAGYRRLFLDVGGFNPLREFWGEWTELNLRLWRCGFPTGYAMDGAYMRHWEQAPLSPTRNMRRREEHVLWGLMCTALEYDAVEEREETAPFWELLESRYVAYSFGADARIRDVLRTALRLLPRMAAAYPQIAAFRDLVSRHPFAFKPFQALTQDDVSAVTDRAARTIAPYRAAAW